jgi:predicted MFS family arabinose efflux permease
VATVARWFDDRRGLALALVLVGSNLGYVTAGPLAAWLIAGLGWRAAYAALGAGSGLLTALAAATVRLPRPGERDALRLGRAARAEAGASPPAGGRPAREAGVTLGAALADPRQWCLNVSWLLMGGLSLMLSVHAVPFARDQGISLTGASLALTAYGVGAVSGRLASGAITDWLGVHATIRAGYAIQALAFLVVLGIPSPGALLAGLAAFGIGFAAADTAFTKAIPDVFGLRAPGAIMGVLTFGWRCGAALGPAAAGFLHDLTGSYTIPFGAGPVAVLVSWALFAAGTARRRTG